MKIRKLNREECVGKNLPCVIKQTDITIIRTNADIK